MSNENGGKEFTALPDGDYLVRLTAFEERETKAGDAMVTGKFQIISGPEGVDGAKNRIVFENYLLTHQNPKAVKVGMAKLRNYANAVGLSVDGGIEDNIEAIGRTLETPFIATLGSKEPYNGKVDNTILEYKAR